MTTFVIAPDHDIVVGIIAEIADGWGGYALIKGRPTPIGTRATRQTAVDQVAALVRRAGLKVGDLVAQEIHADVSVAARPWSPAKGGRHG